MKRKTVIWICLARALVRFSVRHVTQFPPIVYMHFEMRFNNIIIP